MKKIISIFLALTLVCIAAVSCGNKSRYNYDLEEYIKLGEYKNLPATAVDAKVTDDDVRAQVDSAIGYYSRSVEVTDRGAQEGDIVNVSYDGCVFDVSNEIITRENVDIRIGFGNMPKEFEDALVGKKAGDTVYLKITLPDPFEDFPEYSGKVAEIAATVNKVSVNEAPVYSDDFVRAFLGYNSISEYEQAVRESLEEKQAQAYYDIVIPQVWKILSDSTEVKKYPDAEVKKYYDAIVNSVREYVDKLGLDFTAFVENNFEMTEDEFYASAMEQAQSDVKEEMICYAIAKAENIKVSSEEYQKRALKYATEKYELESVEQLEKQYSRDDIENLILCDLVREFIADNASITYSDEN